MMSAKQRKRKKNNRILFGINVLITLLICNEITIHHSPYNRNGGFFFSQQSQQSNASSQSSFCILNLFKVASKLNGMTTILYYHFRHGECFSSAQILNMTMSMPMLIPWLSFTSNSLTFIFSSVFIAFHLKHLKGKNNNSQPIAFSRGGYCHFLNLLIYFFFSRLNSSSIWNATESLDRWIKQNVEA